MPVAGISSEHKLINNGLSYPEHPNWGGWGGCYEFYTPYKEPARDDV